ncbi:MAG: alpha/beta hydrolase [Cyclobacteriaceae bacterium]
MDCAQWYERGFYREVNGLRVFVRREGLGETLLCIHGFPTSSWDYAPLWPHLVGRFDVVAFDLIGLGRSSKPKQSLPVSLQADIIESLLGTFGIEDAHILAHDLGDTIAQELLARNAEGMSSIAWRSCIFLNGGIFPEVHRPRLIQKLLLSPFGSFVAKLTSEKTFGRTMKKIFGKEHPPTEEFISASWQLLIEEGGAGMMPRLIRYMNERWEHRDRWVSPLEKATVPLRLINGIQDPVSGLHAATYYKELVPDADVLLLENAGHYPHVETPEEVWVGILEFHARQPGNRIYN